MAIKYTFSKETTSQRVARWVMRTQEYDFDIEYLPGQQMVHADALSQNPPNERKTIAVLRQGDISTNN